MPKIVNQVTHFSAAATFLNKTNLVKAAYYTKTTLRPKLNALWPSTT